MSYQFLKIEQVPGGVEIAYLYDTDTGVVIRTPVRDYVAASLNPPPAPNYIPPTPFNPPAPQYVVNPVQKEMAIDGNGDLIVAEKTMPRAPSIMPPHLRAAMIPADQPGAYTERRVV